MGSFAGVVPRHSVASAQPESCCRQMTARRRGTRWDFSTCNLLVPPFVSVSNLTGRQTFSPSRLVQVTSRRPYRFVSQYAQIKAQLARPAPGPKARTTPLSIRADQSNSFQCFPSPALGWARSARPTTNEKGANTAIHIEKYP